jgi:hypothetical protein
MTVYVVCVEVDGRNLISDVYRDRADALDDAKDAVEDSNRYTVECLRTGGEIEVFERGETRHIVYPFVLQ